MGWERGEGTTSTAISLLLGANSHSLRSGLTKFSPGLNPRKARELLGSVCPLVAGPTWGRRCRRRRRRRWGRRKMRRRRWGKREEEEEEEEEEMGKEEVGEEEVGEEEEEEVAAPTHSPAFAPGSRVELLGGDGVGEVPGEGPEAVAALVVGGHLHAAPRQGGGGRHHLEEGKKVKRRGREG